MSHYEQPFKLPPPPPQSNLSFKKSRKKEEKKSKSLIVTLSQGQAQEDRFSHCLVWSTI